MQESRITPANSYADDVMQPFQLEANHLRGRLVKLGSSLDMIIQQHAYPLPVAELMGEAMAVAAALGTSLKYEGVFTFQARSDGAVRLLVADVMSNGGIRAYAKFDADKIPTDSLPSTLLGKGHLAFTVDQQLNNDRYQGVVSLEGVSLAEAVQHYFRQSEQLPTGIVAAVRRDTSGHWHAGCLMLQQMPREGGNITTVDTSIKDDWYRAMMLMGTVGADELCDPSLPPNDLLYRLFHEDGVRVFEPHSFHHQCRCSETRVETMLRSLPRDEIEGLAVDGVVSVNCEFCNKTYAFNRDRMAELYGVKV